MSFLGTLGSIAKIAAFPAALIPGAGPAISMGLGALGGMASGAAEKKKAQAAANDRQSLLQRNQALAETNYASKEPLRQAGLGAISRHFAMPNGRGMFQTPVNA